MSGKIVFGVRNSVNKTATVLEFFNAVQNNMTVEYHGIEFVVMDRNHYEDISKKLASAQGVIDEAEKKLVEATHLMARGEKLNSFTDMLKRISEWRKEC